MVVKGCMCILPCEHIHGGRGQYLDCPWDFRSKALASQSFAEDKDSSSERALPLLLRLS